MNDNFLLVPWRAARTMQRFVEQTLFAGLLFSLGRSDDDRWAGDPLVSTATNDSRATFLD